jgi:hypothetical protein
MRRAYQLVGVGGFFVFVLVGFLVFFAVGFFVLGVFVLGVFVLGVFALVVFVLVFVFPVFVLVVFLLVVDWSVCDDWACAGTASGMVEAATKESRANTVISAFINMLLNTGCGVWTTRAVDVAPTASKHGFGGGLERILTWAAGWKRWFSAGHGRDSVVHEKTFSAIELAPSIARTSPDAASR